MIKKFYGDNQRWWVGTVEEGSAGTDPILLGRCRVRIDGIHGSDISLNDLPYAQTILPPTGGGTSGIGENPQLLPGAKVVGFFLDGGASQLPIIHGYLPHIGIPTITQQEIIAKTKPVILQTNVHDKKEIVHHANHSTNQAVGSDDVTRIWNWFAKKSSGAGMGLAYKNHHIAGIIGNLIAESGSFPEGGVPTVSTTIRSGITGEASQGLAQWNPDGAENRLQKLKDFAKKEKKSYTDLYLQCAFIDHELRNVTGLAGNFFQTLNTEQAAMTFMRYYLRPSYCELYEEIKVKQEDGTIKTKRRCKVFFKDRHGLTFKTDRYPVAKGGRFPSGSRDRVRSHEETRLRHAVRIFNLKTSGAIA